MTSKKPRSWEQAKAHPNVEAINPEEHDDRTKFYVSIAEHVYNPVTDAMGGAFFVDNFKELQSQLDWENVDQSDTNFRTQNPKFDGRLSALERQEKATMFLFYAFAISLSAAFIF